MPEQTSEYVEPPEGWLSFGSLVDYDGPAECSQETGEDGLPLWERRIPPEPVRHSHDWRTYDDCPELQHCATKGCGVERPTPPDMTDEDS